MVIEEIEDQDLGFEAEEVSEWSERRASRCILQRKGKIALLYVGKYDYYKLPGGGVDSGETDEEALRREVREEVGSEITIGDKIGSIVERKSHQATIQKSVCYMAEETESGEPDFTQKEREEGFKVKWFSPKKAHQKLIEQNPDRYMP